jgi:hypothetical protein
MTVSLMAVNVHAWFILWRNLYIHAKMGQTYVLMWLQIRPKNDNTPA